MNKHIWILHGYNNNQIRNADDKNSDDKNASNSNKEFTLLRC